VTVGPTSHVRASRMEMWPAAAGWHISLAEPGSMLRVV
jgi:hypothetical protein